MKSPLRTTPVSGFLCLCALIALLGPTPVGAAAAGFPDAPWSVCPGDEFDVNWIGPGGPGDEIVIANPEDPPAARLWDYAPTSEGNPLTLTAPNTPGSYKVRYVQDGPGGILSEADLQVIVCGGASCSVREYPVEQYAVAVHALQSASGEQYSQPGPFTVKQICSASDVVAPIVSGIIGRAEAPLDVPASVIESHVTTQLRDARNAVCTVGDDMGSVNWSTFVYSHCRMAGQSGNYSMDIHLPPGTGDGMMSIADHNERKVIQMTLKRNLEAAQTGTGSGWSSGINMTAVGNGTRLGYQTDIYDYDYKMGLGLGGLGELDQESMGQVDSAQALGNMVSVTVSGTAHLAQCIPGVNILTAYHEKLSTELQPSDGSIGAFAGIIKNQVGMLEHGIPLDINSKTTGKIAGMPMVSGSDRNLVTGFEIIEMPDDWCTKSLMPESYEVINLDQQISEATAGAEPGQPQSCDCSCDAFKKMQGMSEAEQKKMQDSPEGMAFAMCAANCMSKWMSCAMR
jgi:hypothetical protein